MTPIRDVLKGLVRRLGLESRTGACRALDAWEEVAGPEIGRRTVARRVSQGIMYVDVESPAWASQLTLMKADLVERLNAKVAGGALKDIRFRARTLRRFPGPAVSNEGPDLRGALHSVRLSEADVQAADRIAGGKDPLAATMKRVILAHRTLSRARGLVGWKTCGECHRTYESGEQCPHCGPVGLEDRARTN